jgi:hypothetical protein
MVWIGVPLTWLLLTMLPCYLLVMRPETRERIYAAAKPVCLALAIAAFFTAHQATRFRGGVHGLFDTPFGHRLAILLVSAFVSSALTLLVAYYYDIVTPLDDLKKRWRP